MQAKTQALESQAAGLQQGLRSLEEARSFTQQLARDRDAQAELLSASGTSGDRHLSSNARQRRDVRELEQLVSGPETSCSRLILDRSGVRAQAASCVSWSDWCVAQPPIGGPSAFRVQLAGLEKCWTWVSSPQVAEAQAEHSAKSAQAEQLQRHVEESRATADAAVAQAQAELQKLSADQLAELQVGSV